MVLFIFIQLSEVIATLGVIGVNEVIDDTTMRDVNDHLSYKTNVANFVNFKQVEFAKFELTLRTPIKNIYDLLLGLFCLTLRRRREKSATKEAFLLYPGNRNRQFHNLSRAKEGVHAGRRGHYSFRTDRRLAMPRIA